VTAKNQDWNVKDWIVYLVNFKQLISVHLIGFSAWINLIFCTLNKLMKDFTMQQYCHQGYVTIYRHFAF
jgi:hypothetical protein